MINPQLGFLTCKNKFNNTVNFRGEPYIPVV
ncbi:MULTISPECIES: phage BR0599 family protein [Wolbachia]|nr:MULTISPECIES: phage BR0599 family protein [Wolbachia]UYC23121.1 phage BR0599 family protein [Wolbachia endosymbiont of Aedes aegypti]